MSNEVAQELATATGRHFLEAPAGFGKTETIALALTQCEGRQLILTHTHAGVDSLKKRLKAHGVAPTSYRVETIDAFCMRYARGYPATSGFSDGSELDNDRYELAKAGSLKVLKRAPIREIIRSAFTGVIVDEYQDCSLLQHEIIKTLADKLPLRVLGDPLQSLFTWKGQNPIDWKANIIDEGFLMIQPLSEPRRWQQPTADLSLGEWICAARVPLSKGQAAVFRDPVKVFPTTVTDLSTALCNAVFHAKKKANQGETIVILHARFGTKKSADEMAELHVQDPYAALLSKHGFSVMMEIKGKLLRKWCSYLDQKQGLALAMGFLQFTEECCRKCTSELAPVVAGLQKGSLAKVRSSKAVDILTWLRSHEESFAIADSEEWIRKLRAFDKRENHHRELFDSMCLAIRRVTNGKSPNLLDAAQAVREQQSHVGRRAELRIISKTLLVKGLQFDHVIVVQPELMDACNQYVAYSRAVKSLTIVTTNASGQKGQIKAQPPVADHAQGVLFEGL